MEKIAVYGAGVIGAGEATLVTGNGYPCIVVGKSEEGLQRCVNMIEQNWDDMISNGLANEINKKRSMELLTITNDSQKLKDSTFIFEAVNEDLTIKEEVYSIIERITDSKAIIASCTSSLNVNDLAKVSSRPQNILVVHPLNPAHMIPLVEIVTHNKNSVETINRTNKLLEKLKRDPVYLNKSVEGLLVNRLHQSLYRESIYLIDEGVTTAKDIDIAFQYLSKRYSSIGLLEFFDDVGLLLESKIAEIVYPKLCADIEVQQYVKDSIESDNLGKTSGKGLHDWTKIDEDDYRYRKQSPFFESIKDWDMPK